MTFLLSSTFTDSLARLNTPEQKAVKTTVFDLQVNPEAPGLSFHKLDRARDKGFWSVRVSDDIRIIIHRSEASLLVCYVDHHDKAYAWAERRRLETHPKTGAAQIVELRERVEEVRSPPHFEKSVPLRLPLERVGDEELLSYGVPLDWLHALKAATDDELLEIAEHLPAEASEAILELATGGRPAKAAERVLAAAESAPTFGELAPFLHPDARRRFRVMSSSEELERALDYPWEQWAVFLHPEQREFVERKLLGPCRVSGSAGTGKTVVALHRAAYLARSNPEARVLLATFSEPLAAALRFKLRALLEHEPRLGERIDVRSLDVLAQKLASGPEGRPRVLPQNDVVAAIREVAASIATLPFSVPFLVAEWRDIVDYWGVRTKEEYLSVPRLGRKSRLSETQRSSLWPLFEGIREKIRTTGSITQADLFRLLADKYSKAPSVYDFAVVDEAQDLSAAQLQFLASLGRHRPDALFFAGDLGQRIFQQPFSWKKVGVDVTGRCKTLRINYRTSHQIRMAVDRLLDPELADVDGNIEKRTNTVSVLNGPAPRIELLPDAAAESKTVGAWIEELLADGFAAEEIGIFVRRPEDFDRARSAVEAAGLDAVALDENILLEHGKVAIGTMSLAKGLEFKAVAVIACDEGIVPLEERIASLGDDADLEDTYTTERQLFYVACTRARDWLLVTGIEPGSEYLEDLQSSSIQT
jgi:mRNA-degrading endonuclease RelE of RelBE toxin-antitoxin system